MAQSRHKYLVLARHGRYHTCAVSDESRGLTETGRMEIHRVADYLISQGIRIGRILHSKLTRARQTAEIFAETLNPVQIAEMPGLCPEDDPDDLIRSIQNESESTLIVSHLPLLDRIAQRIPGVSEYPGSVYFPQGGVLCCIRTANGLEPQSLITPEMLKAKEA